MHHLHDERKLKNVHLSTTFFFLFDARKYYRDLYNYCRFIILGYSVVLRRVVGCRGGAGDGTHARERRDRDGFGSEQVTDVFNTTLFF